MITAVVEDEEIWTGEFESEKDIYFVEFADLNFDGQLEFIVTDNLYPDDFYFHANAYYLENGVAFRTKREKFSYKIEKVRFCKNV